MPSRSYSSGNLDPAFLQLNEARARTGGSPMPRVMSATLTSMASCMHRTSALRKSVPISAAVDSAMR